MSAILEVSICIILPATFFVTASSVMLPELIDIRLFYLGFSILFLVNAFSTDMGTADPFYIFTQGDLEKLIWQHPKSPVIYAGSAALNLLFRQLSLRRINNSIFVNRQSKISCKGAKSPSNRIIVQA